MEAEILKEGMEIARSRKWIAHSPLSAEDDQ
jgi:transposase